MKILNNSDNLKELADKLNFKEKLVRAEALIEEAYKKYG